MIVKGLIRKGEYYDSVSLMIVSKELGQSAGIIDSSVIMGTHENLAILKAAGLYTDNLAGAGDTDLVIGIMANTENDADEALKQLDTLLKKIRSKTDKSGSEKVASMEKAVEHIGGANLALISIAGKYASHEARKALDNNLHVMLFSDNVSLEDEVELKQLAIKKGLLLMGPDCGTAIINGIPLAFANVVNRGNIGIVAASGTGLQEVSSMISNNGGGISQAIGTGGRDVKKEVGGMMFIEAIKALENDEKTKVIVLISKPPHPDVLEKIAGVIPTLSKPVAGIFIGGNPDMLRKAGAIPAQTLEETALIALELSKGQNYSSIKDRLAQNETQLQDAVKKISKSVKGKYIRGLFSGGTLCDEAQLILKESIGLPFSNTPLDPQYKLPDILKSRENTILDMGDDEFTSGRPHPMIDFSLRNKRILQEAMDKEVAIILFDVVLGYGAHLAPATELEPAIKQAMEISPHLKFICAVTGTPLDPQNREKVCQSLVNMGVIVMPSNAAACKLSSLILKGIHQ